MENEKKAFVHIENYTGEEPIKIIYREDKPMEVLPPIPAKKPEPVCILGTIGAPREWLEKRNLDLSNCVLYVNREGGKISLDINAMECHAAHEPYEQFDAGYAGGKITGEIQYTNIYRKLCINNPAKYFTTAGLAKIFRLNRHIFPDREQLSVLTTKLKSVEATVTGNYKKEQENHGNISKTQYYSENIQHNLPASFTIEIAVFKGSPKERYEIEIDADYIDEQIMIQLVSPALAESDNTERDRLIDEEVAAIAARWPELAVIEQ